MENKKTRKAYFIEEILSNLNSTDYTYEILASQNKNKILRSYALKYYYTYFTGEKVKYLSNDIPPDGKGTIKIEGIIFNGVFSKGVGFGKFITDNNCEFKAKIKDYNIVNGSGYIGFEDKIIKFNGFINTNTISKFEQKLTTIQHEATITNINSNKSFTGVIKTDIINYLHIIDGKGTLILNKSEYEFKDKQSKQIMLKDQSGQSIECTVCSSSFITNYIGKIQLYDNIYEGNFEIDNEENTYFIGTITNVKFPKYKFEGTANSFGLPLVGQGSFIYKNFLFEGFWKINEKCNFINSNSSKSRYIFEGTVVSIEEYFLKITGIFNSFIDPYKAEFKMEINGLTFVGEIKKGIIYASVTSKDGSILKFNCCLENRDIYGEGTLSIGNYTYVGNWNKCIFDGKIFKKGVLLEKNPFIIKIVCDDYFKFSYVLIIEDKIYSIVNKRV